MNNIDILNLLDGDSEGFKESLKEQLNDALRSHPRIIKSTRLTKIYEQIKSLNEQIKSLIKEADSLEDELTEPNEQDLDYISSHSDPELDEGKMMGAKCFDFDPESIGLQDTNDNVEKMVVKDMKILDGSEAPSSVPLFQEGPELDITDPVTGKPPVDNTDITSNAKMDDQTLGRTKSSETELRREGTTGFDSTFNNVVKVKVLKDFLN